MHEGVQEELLRLIKTVTVCHLLVKIMIKIKALMITVSTITLTLLMAFFAAYGMLKFAERFL